jgi:hypothetical protein
VLAETGRRADAVVAFDEAERMLDRAASERARVAGRTLRGFLDHAQVPALIDQARAHQASSDYVRFAIRLVERLIAVDAPDALVIDPEGCAFRPPGGAVVELSRRVTAKRILAALSHARFENPGRALSTLELFAVGWPGEHPHVTSAQNRVWVAIANLRSLGLRTLLRSSGDGYLLDPEVPMIRRPLTR